MAISTIIQLSLRTSFRRCGNLNLVFFINRHASFSVRVFLCAQASIRGFPQTKAFPLGDARILFPCRCNVVSGSKSLPLGGEGGSAYAESDEGLTYPKDHLDKEYATFPRSSINTQPHRIRHLKERLSPHPSPAGRHLLLAGSGSPHCPSDIPPTGAPRGEGFLLWAFLKDRKRRTRPRGEGFFDSDTTFQQICRGGS